MLSYPVTLDVPFPLVLFVSRPARQNAAGRSAAETGTRALSCWKQAVFGLASVPGPTGHPQAGPGSGISRATAYRYMDEAVEVLAAKAPTCARLWTAPLSCALPT